MRAGETLLIVAGLLAVAVGCSSGSAGGGAPRGDVGAACVDGSNCQPGLVCVVSTVNPEAGVCTAAPAACNGTLACACMGELESQCSSGGNCEGVSGDYAVACAQNGTYRQQGETCSSLIGCAGGLYCYIPAAGHAGTCTPLPAACGGTPSCDCLQSAHSCGGSLECSVGGDLATLACR